MFQVRWNDTQLQMHKTSEVKIMLLILDVKLSKMQMLILWQLIAYRCEVLLKENGNKK